MLCLMCACTACAGLAQKEMQPPATGAAFAPIYVVNHGFHSGLTIRRSDIPRGLFPESEDFPKAEWLELGWGDWDYYQADDPGLGLALKALFWPTASVLHVMGFSGAVAERFAGFEVARIELPPEGLDGLMLFIHHSFAREGATKAAPLNPGLYGNSRFYPAIGTFHLFNTCNTWVARALEAAGFSMGLFRPVTAPQLMGTLRRSGMLQVPGGQ